MYTQNAHHVLHSHTPQPCACISVHLRAPARTSVQANPWVAVYAAPAKPATVPSAAVVATPLSALSAAAAVAGGPAWSSAPRSGVTRPKLLGRA